MTDQPAPIKRALISVSDKSGLIEFGAALAERGVDLISTGGTAQALRGAGLAGLFLAIPYGFHNALATELRPLYLFLLNKWYVDEIYDFLFTRPAKFIGRFLWKRGDGNVIDGFLNGMAMGVVPFITRLAGRAQSGFVFHYAFAMILGLAALITWMTVVGG